MHGQEIKVPNIIGQNIDAGLKTLNSMNFRVSIDSVFQSGKPGGEIIDQNPAPEEMVKDHRTIYLTIVKYNAPMVKLPGFEDTPYKEFESNLKGLGLEVDSITYQPDIAKDLVLGVNYRGRRLVSGSSLPRGSKVSLILGDGLGGNLVPLPHLLGLRLDEARFAIRGAQLILGQVSYQGIITDSSFAKIISQSPSPGLDSNAKVPQGTVINLILEQNPH
jgi:beta-lactam-binding protein with PASTA domain